MCSSSFFLLPFLISGAFGVDLVAAPTFLASFDGATCLSGFVLGVEMFVPLILCGPIYLIGLGLGLVDIIFLFVLSIPCLIHSGLDGIVPCFSFDVVGVVDIGAVSFISCVLDYGGIGTVLVRLDVLVIVQYLSVNIVH